MIISNVIQGTPEWFKEKAGVPSASCFDKIITTTGKPSAQAKKYMYQLIGERMLGRKEESYQSFAMQRGVELEEEARNYYEFHTGSTVETVGICFDDDMLSCCSPDGLPLDGGLEIKCPLLPTHVEYLLNNKLPATYYQQVQGSLFVTGLEWWDFMSYYPGLDPLIVRVYPDIDFHLKLSTGLLNFNQEMRSLITKMEKK